MRPLCASLFQRFGFAPWVVAILYALVIGLPGQALAQVSFDDPEPLFSNPLPSPLAPRLTPDQKQVFLSVFGDVYQSTRETTTANFPAPERIDLLSTVENLETGLALAADGLRIYLSRTPTSGREGTQLFAATRPDRTSAFESIAPIPLQATSGSVWRVTGISADELELWGEMSRPVPPGATTSLTAQTEIWRATRDDLGSGFGAMQFIAALNTHDHEEGPAPYGGGTGLVFTRRGPLSGLPGTIMLANRLPGTEQFEDPVFAGGVNLPDRPSLDPWFPDPPARIFFSQNNQILSAYREVEAELVLPSVEASAGSILSYPLQGIISTPGITQVECRLTFDALTLNWQGVSVLDVLPGTVLEVELELPSLLRIVFQAAQAIPTSPEPQDLFTVDFLVPLGVPTGTSRAFRTSGEPLFDGVPTGRPLSGRVTFLPPEPAVSRSSWQLR